MISDSGMVIPEELQAEMDLAAWVDWTRKLAGVCPTTFLKLEKKVELELNPQRSATMSRFSCGSPVNTRFASAIRYSLT